MNESMEKQTFTATIMLMSTAFCRSPVFDIADCKTSLPQFLSPRVSATDYCFNSSYCDGLTISRSINGGTSIVPTNPARAYTNTVRLKIQLWSVLAGKCPLSDFRQTQQIFVSVCFRSDEFNNYEGIGIDDFHIYDSVYAIYEEPRHSNLQSGVPTTDGWFNYLNWPPTGCFDKTRRYHHACC